MNTFELRKAIPTEFNLSFHDVIYRRGMNGLLLAFVVCKDKGVREKYYWGEVGVEGDKNEIMEIMRAGAKWRGMDDDGNVLL